MLRRTQGFQASATAIGNLLKEEGYEAIEVAPRRHPDRVRRFERAKPNQLWQSDLFNFTLAPTSRRIHVVAFLDDRSRFITGFGVSGSSASGFVIEVLRTAVANFGAPEEVLTDRGPQYHSWRGTSAFRKVLGSMGVKHILARPRHPQTVGKTERWWKTLWGECLQAQRPRTVEEARERIGHFVDHYESSTRCYSSSCCFGEGDYALTGVRPRTPDSGLESSHGLLHPWSIEVADLDNPGDPLPESPGAENAVMDECARLSHADS
jgi:transposase InsO family protein